jgi:lipopolysaccharide assembly outer membrane protein LptD (OstA)
LKIISLLLFPFIIVLLFFLPAHIFPNDDLLLEEALRQDINTSDFYDLSIWLEKLELPSKGSIDDLRAQLYLYYDLELKEDKTVPEQGRSIIIESARELNYMDNLEIDQNYIILQGEVALEMIDYNNNTSHKIKADKIVFNQTNKTISASGNIIYEINREKDNEYFYGESLVFEIENWEGIFFEGVSETKRLVENNDIGSSEEIKFFFSGENIYRGSGNRIELNNGSITSSKSENPYYRLDADKIWVLGPGEWAITNAVLYVGRIPVFYFPFFFIPGDELVVNPALGYKLRDGYFINTTTYLLGLKEESEQDTFSFLESSNEGSVSKEKIREGLFLRNSENDLNDKVWPYNNESYIKLLVDYYSRKGVFLGLEGDLEFDSLIQNIDIFTAISLSRYIYLDTKIGIYTPFRVDSGGNYVSDIEESTFLGQVLPFRYAFDLNMILQNNWMKLNLDIPFYSDINFRSDFMNREEGLKWADLINNSETSVNNSETVMSSLGWNINGSITPQVNNISPVVEALSLDTINIELNWLSRTVDHPEKSILLANYYNYDNSPSFYYPSSLILPEIAGRISGTLFQTASNDSQELKTEIIINDSEYLENPWSIDENNIIESNADELIKPPEILEYIPIEIYKKNDIFANSLKYSFVPSFSINTIYNSDIPLTALDIDFTGDYSIFTAQGTSSLDYSFNISDSLFDFSNTSIFSMNFKEHFNPSELSDTWTSYLLQDKNATNYKLTDNINIISKPFINSNLLNESIFTYKLNTTLYNKYWDSDSSVFTDNYFLWNNESISTHSIKMELKFYDSVDYQIFNLYVVLPPQNIELHPEINFTKNNFSGGLKTSFNYIESNGQNSWSNEPYESYLQYNFFDKDYLKQIIILDFEEMNNSVSQTELSIDKFDSNIIITENLDLNLKNYTLNRFSSDLKLWFFSFNYLMEDMYGYYFMLPSGWLQESDSKFQASNASAGLNFDYEPDPFWKNRIRFALNLDSSWTMDLQKYTDTAFVFNLGLSLFISEFVEFSFISKSVNRASYRYFPGNSDIIGLQDLNIFSDLIKSFNFFNNDDREDSNFNLEYIAVSLIHHLSDWDLSIEYSGEPVLTTVNNKSEYQWESQFSLFVTWKPVPEIKKNVKYTENEIIFN